MCPLCSFDTILSCYTFNSCYALYFTLYHLYNFSSKHYLLRQGFIIMQILITEEITGHFMKLSILVFLTHNDLGGKGNLVITMKNSAVNTKQFFARTLFFKQSVNFVLGLDVLKFDSYFFKFPLPPPAPNKCFWLRNQLRCSYEIVLIKKM